MLSESSFFICIKKIYWFSLPLLTFHYTFSHWVKIDLITKLHDFCLLITKDMIFVTITITAPLSFYFSASFRNTMGMDYGDKMIFFGEMLNKFFTRKSCEIKSVRKILTLTLTSHIYYSQSSKKKNVQTSFSPFIFGWKKETLREK